MKYVILLIAALLLASCSSTSQKVDNNIDACIPAAEYPPWVFTATDQVAHDEERCRAQENSLWEGNK